MKKYLNLYSLSLLLMFIFSVNAFAQNSSRELTAQEVKERAEVTAFVDSFTQEYYKTYDLTKVPASFFVSDYRKRNFYPFFVDKFDSSLTDDEKFENAAMIVDLANVVTFIKLEESDFDIEKAFNTDNDENVNEEEILPQKMRDALQKYPKALRFLDEENSNQFQSVADFRDSIKDFKSVLQELRDVLVNASPEKRNKLNKFLTDNKENLFEFKYAFECSKDDCEGFADKTKMFYYEADLTTLLMVKDKNQLKVVKVVPTTK